MLQTVVVWEPWAGAAGFGGSEALYLGDWGGVSPPSLMPLDVHSITPSSPLRRPHS